MKNRLSFKIHKSSIVAVLIIYYMLMESVFPFEDNSSLRSFFYWSKFIIAIAVIAYSVLFACKRETVMRRVCKETRILFLTPWIVMLLYSCIIWIIQGTDAPYVTRGISNFLSNVLPFLMGVDLVLIFKEKIVRSVIIAVCLMAFTNYIAGVVVNGPIFFIQLFNVNCIEHTFLKYKELHEIAYIIGLLLLYFFLNRNYRMNKVWFISCFAVFFFAWKRIGILALFISLLFYILLRLLNRSGKKFSVGTCSIIALIMCILYVGMSASDELISVLNKYGIDMMGRDIIYSYFRRFCDFSITYPGRGIGFVSRQFTYVTEADFGAMFALKQGLHNDLFSLYLEIGMIGFIMWTIYQLGYIPQKIKKMRGIDCAVQCFTYIIFTFVTYTTDNTLRYFVYQMTLIILITVTIYENIEKPHTLE